MNQTNPNSHRKSVTTKPRDIQLWHCRLGHMNPRYSIKLEQFAADGISFYQTNSAFCEIFYKGMSVKKPFTPSASKANQL